MKKARIAAIATGYLALALAGCDGTLTDRAADPDTHVAQGEPDPPADFPGKINTVPPSPAPGESRTGTFYNIYLQSPNAVDEQIAITVFEPAIMEGGKKYPLVLEHHGFGFSRKTNLNETTGGLLGDVLGGVSIVPFVHAGYGVISIDARGHGESGGTIRSMDPDFEGRNLVAILDWAQVKLDWIMRGNDLDGGPDNIVVGAIGPSYGGGFQLILNAVDPRKRLDALAPQITWHDLGTALISNGVWKMGWIVPLLAVGTTAGSGIDRLHWDPFTIDSLLAGLQTNRPSEHDYDWYHYHSQAYFCEGRPVATNGGPGTAPIHAPVPPAQVHALFMQGMRDTLFPFNEAYRNYECLRRAAGDVRLLTYEGGHNSLLLVPDPGIVYEEVVDGGGGATFTRRCGDLDHEVATLAFFEEHLKGVRGAADAVIPREPCISLGPDDRLLTRDVIVGKRGTPFEVPAMRTLSGVPDAPTVAEIGYVAPGGGAVLAGIPYAELEVAPAIEAVGEVLEPIVFVGVGRYRLPTGQPAPGLAPAPVVDLVDNQVTPLRGYGLHRVDLVGVGERLNAGDRLVLLIYGAHDQYHAGGSINAAEPSPVLVSVGGKVWLPLQ